MKTVLWYINSSKLFSRLSEKAKMDLSSMLRTTNVKKGSMVYGVGEKSETVYLLKEGGIKISRVSEDGKELTMDILKPGDIFGETSLSGEGKREDFAEAVEDSYICDVKKKDFEDLIGKNPELSFTLVKLMGLRMRKIESRFEDVIFKDVRTRVVSLLKDVAGKYGVPARDGAGMEIRLSHQELANLAGATRETVTIELNNLKKEGFISEIKRKSIIIPKARLS